MVAMVVYKSFVVVIHKVLVDESIHSSFISGPRDLSMPERQRSP